MEDHLRNKNRLMKEWEALCSYQAEPSAVAVAQSEANGKKNRCPDSVPCECRQLQIAKNLQMAKICFSDIQMSQSA